MSKKKIDLKKLCSQCLMPSDSSVCKKCSLPKGQLVMSADMQRLTTTIKRQFLAEIIEVQRRVLARRGHDER